MKIRKSQLKTIIEEVMNEAKAQFGGEVIDARDLPDKMSKEKSATLLVIWVCVHQ